MASTMEAFDAILKQAYSGDYEFRIGTFAQLHASRPGYNGRIILDEVKHLPISMQVGIGAAVALGGLAWVIARRNKLAAEADEATFVEMVRTWIAGVWQRILLAIASDVKALPAHEEVADGR